MKGKSREEERRIEEEERLEENKIIKVKEEKRELKNEEVESGEETCAKMRE